MIQRRGCRFRTIINANSRDFRSLEESLRFIRKNWKEKTSHASISLMCLRSIAREGFSGDKHDILSHPKGWSIP
jgi:hypothetical protein